ncbi:hypothetical protein GCM10009639_34340 [Kitasatospora putterlickiae]|uniref:Uncharacterized protein n=1 Tax=Kitasatospora putterlickiae TaxID=221725 RepID=A0ABN1Y3U7_9ACTN
MLAFLTVCGLPGTAPAHAPRANGAPSAGTQIHWRGVRIHAAATSVTNVANLTAARPTGRPGPDPRTPPPLDPLLTMAYQFAAPTAAPHRPSKRGYPRVGSGASKSDKKNWKQTFLRAPPANPPRPTVREST